MPQRCCDQFPWCRCPIILDEVRDAEFIKVLRSPPKPLKFRTPAVEVEEEMVEPET